MGKITLEKSLKSVGTRGIPYAVSGKNIPYRGSWRTHIPIFDLSRCIKCHLCWLQCPDTAIKIKNDGFVYADMALCKGCHICAEICPVKCIKMEREKK